MTNADLRRAMTRVTDARVGRRAELAADARPPVRAEDRLGLAFAPGDRVFDTVSGEEGTVIRGLANGAGQSAALVVALPSGGEVNRSPSQLVARPRPPAGRS